MEGGWWRGQNNGTLFFSFSHTCTCTRTFLMLFEKSLVARAMAGPMALRTVRKDFAATSKAAQSMSVPSPFRQEAKLLVMGCIIERWGEGGVKEGEVL